MLDSIDIVNVLFLDIETVSQHRTYHDLSDTFKPLWEVKARQILRKEVEIEVEEAANLYPERAAIFAEFGKICCISVGLVTRDKNGELKARLKSFFDHDEKKLLEAFADMLDKHFSQPYHCLCGHNIREFDIPYLCRRYLVHQLPLPKKLDIAGKKPWEVSYLLDTLDLWKFGDFKNYTSLKLLTAVFGIPSPKDDMDGSDVGRVYWEEGDLERIATYCEKDVLAVLHLLFRYKCLPLLEGGQVVRVGGSNGS